MNPDRPLPSAPHQRPLALAKFVALALFAVLAWRRRADWLRSILLHLAGATWARNLVTQTPAARRMARRFVAGESIDDALAVTRNLNDEGRLVTLDFLGESVHSRAEAIAAADEIETLLQAIDDAQLRANVSVKLSQLGVKIDEELALSNMRRLLKCAAQLGNRVRIDMEESALLPTTLRLYRRLRDEENFSNVGVVIQAYLYRSAADIEALIEEGAWVRLCKGAYMEPAAVAFPLKADTDANYIRLAERLLSSGARANGVYAGLATHDERMVRAVIDFSTANEISASDFEFQMLYGIGRELQETLVDQGYQLRVYLPYGTAWYPYFVRRLAERPANLWFFLSSAFK